MHLCGALLLLIASLRGVVHAQDVGSFALEDSVGFLADLAAMPEKEQDTYLELAGMMLMNDGSTDCNIFGGTKSCKEVPIHSAFVDNCKAHRDNFKVDCAYYTESVTELTTDPAQNLEKMLGAGKTDSLKENCPECLNNLESLWCAQVLPTCGSFKAHVQKALLPAVLKVKQQQEAGEPVHAALAAAVPGLLKAMAKTMACKEMCQAVIRTCSCDAAGTKSLGDVLTAATNQVDGLPDDITSGLGVDEILLKDVWDQPLCDLFVSRNDPEFAGVCDLAIVESSCTNKDAYCDSISDGDKEIVEEMVGVEIAHGLLGFMDGKDGILKQTDVLGKEAQVGSPPSHYGDDYYYDLYDYFDSPSSSSSSPSSRTPPSAEWQSDMDDVADINRRYLAPPVANWSASNGGSSHEQHHHSAAGAVGIFFLVLGLMAISAVLGIFGWKKYQEYRERNDNAGEYHSLNEGPSSPVRGLGL